MTRSGQLSLRLSRDDRRLSFAPILAILCLLSLLDPLGSPARADPADAGLEAAAEHIRPDSIRGHMGFLADDLLEGRRPGTRGQQLAAKYVAAWFGAIGLKPAGNEGTYLQNVPLRHSMLVKEKSTITLRYDGTAEDLVYGRDFLMQGDFANKEMNVSGGLVFVGFGITAPELKHNDYADIDARGKIVVLLSGAPASFPHNQRAFYSSDQQKMLNAVAHGAVGVLSVFTPQDSGRYPWEWLMPQFEMGGMCWVAQDGALHNDFFGYVSQLRGDAFLSRPAAERVFRHTTHSLVEVFAAAKTGKVQGFDLRVDASIRTVSKIQPVDSPNVAAVLRGSDPSLRDEYVVITAHSDHLGVGKPVNGDAIYNGAVDDASGVAAVIEIARTFARLAEPPRRSLLFLVVTGEEMRLLGSDYFAHHPTVPWDGIVANINIDALLVFHPLLDTVAIGAEHSSLGGAVGHAMSAMGLKVGPDPAPEEVMFIRNDAYSFVRQGVPAVLLLPGMNSGDPKRDGLAMLKDWLKSRYHTPKDDMGQPLDFEAGAKFTQACFRFAYEVATEKQRPTWTVGDFFGDKFGRKAGR